MPPKKKPAKNVVVVGGPTQAMLAYQKKYHAKQLPKLRAKAAAEKKKEETLKRQKGVEVKDLHKAIMLGLSIEDAAVVALDRLKDELEICKPGDWGGPGEEIDMEGIIRMLVEKNDHSIRFEAEEDCDGSITNWRIYERPYQEDGPRSIFYSAIERTWAENDAENDADTLNQFVLDFYGIKKHAEIKKTAKEIRAEIKSIRDEIKSKKAEIEDLTAKMRKLSKSL